MSYQSSNNPANAWYRQIVKEWRIDSLLTDLGARTQSQYTQNTRQDLLLGLLCGYGAQRISQDLHRNEGSVRAGLCNIYRDIETLTGKPDRTVRSANLAYILEKYGYRIGVTASVTNNHNIPHNLPSPTYTEFIGREADMKKLLKRLSPVHGAHMITVHGIGGVGKTALVLAAAYLCLKASCENYGIAPKFDAIIFTSAKQQELLTNEIIPMQHGQRNLREIFREIAHALSDLTIIQSPPNEQRDHVRQILSQQRTLLIVDNMETIDDRSEVIEFLYNLPICVKVVITTREKIALLPISLQNLTLEDGLQLIQQQAEDKSTNINEDDSRVLYERTGGVPLAIVYAIGQVSSGYSLNSVLERLASASGDVARFCFKQSVQGVRGQPAHKLLMSLAIFPNFPVQIAVAEVSGLIATDPDSVNDGLAHLQKLSLVNLNPETKRYELLSLTREYALAELATDSVFERQARQRWVKWYLDFAHRYAGEDWENRINYKELKKEEGNLRSVLYWCRDQNHYEEVRELWLLLNHYANLYAYWDDRLDWLQWLIEQSQLRGDWSSLVKVMLRKTWLLIRECSLQSLQEADEMLQRAWVLKNNADLCVQADLAESFARLRIRQEDYIDARIWLDREQELVTQADLEEQKHIRYYIPVLYHHAIIFYQENNYSEAKSFFQSVMDSARRINWYRVINSAQNWLADIAIKQGDRDSAQLLLTEGLTVAESSENKRRLARYQASLALWEKKWGSTQKASKLVAKAMDIFKHLGMTKDEEKMQLFLDSL
jgi:NB-ARC domain